MAAAPTRVKVRFATNRNHVGGKVIFGNEIADTGDPSKYRTGTVEMRNTNPSLPDAGWNIEGDPVIDPVEGEGDAPVLADRAAAPQSPAADKGILAFRKDVAKASPTDFGIVLLPGFAATFQDTLRRSAQIAAAYGASKVFCFSWPANGRITLDDYKQDQRDARLSARTIALSLVRLFKEAQDAGEEPPRIELVAHSMGAFALRHALQHIKAVAQELVTNVVFRGALLVAADEDFDALSKADKLGPLLKLANRVTVYTADNDIALAAAATPLLNNFARLGMFGPKDIKTLPTRVTRIDITAHSWSEGDFGETHYHHQYYRLSKGVIADIRQVLAGKTDIQPRYPHPTGGFSRRAWKVPFYKT